MTGHNLASRRAGAARPTGPATIERIFWVVAHPLSWAILGPSGNECNHED
jgi:hypothetical protein